MNKAKTKTAATRKNAGFTLVELLVTMLIMGVILSVLLVMMSSTARTYRTNEELAQRQEASEAAQQLLTYEIALAGYKGTDGTPRNFSGPNTLIITKGSTSAQPDTIAVRYFEDRFAAASERYVVFGLNTADKTLTRSENSGTPEVVVDNIANLKIVQYIKRTGEKVEATPGTPVPDNLAALNIEIQFASNRTWRFPIGLNNAQQAVVN